MARKKILANVRFGTRLMTPEAFKIAQKFGVTEAKQKPVELTGGVKIGEPKKQIDPAKVPPEITGGFNQPDPLQEAENKMKAFQEFKKSLAGKNKGDLLAVAKERGYPESEYAGKNKADLTTYILEKYEGANQ